jgi:hypothetical protein
VAEDYAAFNVDVTTERPAAFTTRTAHALITRNTDADGNANPSSGAGGVAYVGAFGQANYATFRPAWIYNNNLGNSESYIAEATSHELGHNLGLSHDGQIVGTTTNAYYGGHGSGDISWGPIMGTGYGRNVSQWSKGEYCNANNSQDDLATLSGKIVYRPDDHGNTPGTATPLLVTGNTNIVCTTPESDPANASPANKGMIELNTDVDVFSFVTGNGPVRLAVNPWVSPASTRGGNVDIVLELRDEAGALLLTNNSAAQTTALIATNLPAGRYYLGVRNAGTGDPHSAAATGYTGYGGVGQYFVSGYVATLLNATLTAAANNPAWGAVTPASGTYPAGTTVQVSATPAPYFRFNQWSGGASGTNNPLQLLLNSNASVTAVFGEVLTTNHPTPLWWLAACGYTNDCESAVTGIGLNGIPVWQSHIAGLTPTNPASQLRLSSRLANGGLSCVLHWNSVSGRVYTVWSSTNLAHGFAPLAGASNLSWTVQSFTNGTGAAIPARFYRLQVQKP